MSVSHEMVEIFKTALKNSLSLIKEQLEMIEKRDKKERTKLLIEVCLYIVFSGWLVRTKG